MKAAARAALKQATAHKVTVTSGAGVLDLASLDEHQAKLLGLQQIAFDARLGLHATVYANAPVPDQHLSPASSHSPAKDASPFVATAVSSKAIPFAHFARLCKTLPNIAHISSLDQMQEGISVLQFKLHLTASEKDAVVPQLFQFGQETKIDVALQADNVFASHKRLIVFDMDSTLIQQEVIDELAREAGVYERISPITESAMRGEIDFNESLRQRVKLLSGQPSSIVDVVRDRIQLTPGALELCTALKKLGYKLAVLSGGFMPLALHVKALLGLDYAFANTLEVQDGLLTGSVVGAIVNGERKAELLTVISQIEGVAKEQPKVQQQAQIRINQPSLANVLYLLGIKSLQSNMVNIDAGANAAYEDVRNDKTETNWLILGYADEKGESLKVVKTGTGGLEEFKTQLKDDEAYFGYVRMVVGNDELSRRAKFLLVSWCGPGVKVMRRGKLSVHIADVKKVISSFAVEISASNTETVRSNRRR
ncbi:hypothetical protein HDU91_001708 [Kappamyces sp. JEL0680]|nr:hypothetical protein HDU91_001708 [Kappamyces sp. JEL0680]